MICRSIKYKMKYNLSEDSLCIKLSFNKTKINMYFYCFDNNLIIVPSKEPFVCDFTIFVKVSNGEIISQRKIIKLYLS